VKTSVAESPDTTPGVPETTGVGADLPRPGDLDRGVGERVLGVTGDERVAAVQRVRPVGRDPGVYGVLMEAVPEHVVDRAVRPVDRDLREVRAAQPGDLGVEVGEQPRLQQRVVGDVDARRQVTDVGGDASSTSRKVWTPKPSIIR